MAKAMKDSAAPQPAARLPSSVVVPRLVEAATHLLASQGPSEIKARSVAQTAGLSATALYYHVGGIPELLDAVVVSGFARLETAFADILPTDDPIADLMALAIACRHFAQENPHLYDLMFGLSTRGSYRHVKSTARTSPSEAFRSAYQHLVHANQRLTESGRIRPGQDPQLIAAQLWTVVHGFITLELADNFTLFDDPAAEVLLPLTVNVMVGLGDSAELAQKSGLRGRQRVDTAS